MKARKPLTKKIYLNERPQVTENKGDLDEHGIMKSAKQWKEGI